MAMMKKATPKPTPKPTTKKKNELIVVLPNGNRVGIKDMRTNPGTPPAKPKTKPKPIKTISDSEYFKRQKEFVDSQKKAKPAKKKP